MIRRIALAIGLLLAPDAAGVMAAGEAGVFAEGSAEVAWAWRRAVTADDGRQLLVAFARANAAQLHFMLLPMRPTGAEIERAAARGGYLHVFFKDGTHYRFRSIDPLLSASPGVKHDFAELRLPDGRVPLALCGSVDGASLLAIVPRSTAQRLLEAAAQVTSADAGSSGVGTNGAGTNSAGAAPPPDALPALIDTRFALVSYGQDGWVVLGSMPEWFDEHAQVHAVALADGLHVFFARRSDASNLHHFRWTDGNWAGLGDVPEVRPADVVDVLALPSAASLIVRSRPDADQRIGLQPVSFQDGAWRQGNPLRLDDGELRVAPRRFAVAALGEDLLVIWLDAGTAEGIDAIRAGRWPQAGGSARAAPVQVKVLASPPSPARDQYTQLLITLAVMTVLLIVVVRRRQDSFITDLPVPDGYVLARLAPRAIAFFIDFFAANMIAGPVLLIPWMAKSGVTGGPQLQEQISLALLQDPDGFFWRLVGCVAMFVVYCTAFEATLAATPGKLAMRLRVCSHRAQRASFASILARNALRMELYPSPSFTPLIVLLLLTRNRQRLGDLIANTLVVEKA